MNEQAEPEPASGDVRASDQERDATLNLLGEHAASGRLTLEELEQRASQALEAKTQGELAALTHDLPTRVGEPVRQRRATRWMVAIMGGSHRKGRMRLTDSVNSIAIMGGDEIDLREAEIEGHELTINIISIMGGSDVFVPDSVDVELEGFSVMGGNEEKGSTRAPRPGAPVIRIRTYNLMGGSTIWRLPPQARGTSLKQARRLAKNSARGELPRADEGRQAGGRDRYGD